ncbi:MAG: CPBP family intramembrane metalloprotease [Cytophagales bacterium]|nr:CPBP family intramembrane metalloprotease [Armatimonadota bacterium]
MLPEQDHSPADIPDSPPVARPGMAVPGTLFIWLILLALSFAAPALIPQKERRVSPGRENSLSVQDFNAYAQSETYLRVAFGVEASERLLGTLGGGGLAGIASASTRNQETRIRSLQDAARNYRKLLKTETAPNIARRILIVEHAAKKPLDTALLTKTLPEALKKTGVRPAPIATEQSFWRELYGTPPSVSAANAAKYEQIVRGMKLRFLQNYVLADLYTAASDPQKAASFRSAFDAAALKGIAAQSAIGLYIGFVALAGLVFLVIFLVAASLKSWTLVKRVATIPQTLSWGELLDAFIFYLAVTRVLGLAIQLVAVPLIPDPTPQASLAVSTGVYAATAVLALAYLWRGARRRGVTLADIGLRAPRGVWGEIAYGFAGYCAALPMVFLLSFLSQQFFQNDPSRTPNPILPLIASERDPFARFVIYLLVAAAAPFFEELFFRGALFAGLRTRFGWVLSAVLSAAVFAVVHPMQDWLPIFGLGFALAAMREMRQSLIPGMTAHFLQNSFSFVVMSVLFGS